MFQTRNLQCIRQTQTIGDDGIATNAPSSVTFSGVVTQNSGDTRQIRDDGSFVQGDITIHTRFRLIAGKGGKDADTIIYKGDKYAITDVADWSDYGRGFVCAQADLIPLSGGQDPDA
jgi:hypothetical protein